MQNSSGFYGYNLSNLYPNMGSGVDQNKETAPEADDHEAYTQADAPAALPGVDKQTKSNILFLLLGMVGVIVLFSRG